MPLIRHLVPLLALFALALGGAGCAGDAYGVRPVPDDEPMEMMWPRLEWQATAPELADAGAPAMVALDATMPAPDAHVPGCIDGSDCSSAQYCNRLSDVCGLPGVCVLVPDCYDPQPVCGCDGITYASPCAAAAAGAAIGSVGACM